MNSHWADREFHAAQILMGDEMQLTKLFQEMNKLSAGMEVNWTAIWLLMLLVYIYIAFFIMDLYTLVKKKTPEETFLIMLLPGSVIATATIMFILFLNIRADARLESAWTKAVSPGLWAELLCLAALYAVFQGLAWKLWRKKQGKWVWIAQWIFSYSLDFIMVALLAVAGCLGLTGGTDLPVLAGRLVSGLGFNLFLYLFLYGIAILCLKMAFLFLAGLTRLCTVRISRFPYREGRHPAASFLLYGALCQNARVRGALAFGIPMLVFAVWVAVAVDDVPEIRIFLPLMCVLGFVLYLLFAVRPLADDMARFAQWGDRKEGLDRFCWEYFLEEPVLKTKDFTLTRHYLADERGMLEVFAFDALEKIDGSWVSDPKKGWVRKLSFLDGGCCTISRNDGGADKVFRYAKQYREMHLLAVQGMAEHRKIQPIGKDSLYYRMLYSVMVALVMMLLLMYQTI